jgi:uncharacterized surface protein with fasciclin (FAS1) repeats
MVFKDYLPQLRAIMPADKTTNMSNITQVVNVDKELKTLKRGVHASDLDQLLSSTGPFTFFAPSDLAFTKLEKGLMSKLLEPQNRTLLTDLLHNHIVNGKISYKELKDGDTLTTVNGRTLHIQVKDGKVSIGDIPVQQRETRISNGIMHMMDAVIL